MAGILKKKKNVRKNGQEDQGTHPKMAAKRYNATWCDSFTLECFLKKSQGELVPVHSPPSSYIIPHLHATHSGMETGWMSECLLLTFVSLLFSFYYSFCKALSPNVSRPSLSFLVHGAFALPVDLSINTLFHHSV